MCKLSTSYGLRVSKCSSQCRRANIVETKAAKLSSKVGKTGKLLSENTIKSSVLCQAVCVYVCGNFLKLLPETPSPPDSSTGSVSSDGVDGSERGPKLMVRQSHIRAAAAGALFPVQV